MPVALHRKRSRSLAALLFLLAGSASCSFYTLGGPGHGTHFAIPPGALQNPDPVVQSWIAYSLAKSACQLEHDGDRPSRHQSFACELRPREVLVQRWSRPEWSGEAHPASAAQDDYLDLLVRVERAGFLAEYVSVYLGQRADGRTGALRLEAFDAWRAEHLGFHRARTRIIGWWSSPAGD